MLKRKILQKGYGKEERFKNCDRNENLAFITDAVSITQGSITKPNYFIKVRLQQKGAEMALKEQKPSRP